MGREKPGRRIRSGRDIAEPGTELAISFAARTGRIPATAKLVARYRCDATPYSELWRAIVKVSYWDYGDLWSPSKYDIAYAIIRADEYFIHPSVRSMDKIRIPSADGPFRDIGETDGYAMVLEIEYRVAGKDDKA